MILEKSCGRCHLTSLSSLDVTYLVKGVCSSLPPSGRDCKRPKVAEWGKHPRSRLRLQSLSAWRAPRLFVFFGIRGCLLRCSDYVARQLASGWVIDVRAPCTERSRLFGCFLDSAALGRWPSLPLGDKLEQTPFTKKVTTRVYKKVKWHRPHDFSNAIGMSNYEACLDFGESLHNYKA